MSLCKRHGYHYDEPPMAVPAIRNVTDRGEYWGPMLKPQDSCAGGAGIGMTGCKPHSDFYIDRNKEHSRHVLHHCHHKRHQRHKRQRHAKGPTDNSMSSTSSKSSKSSTSFSADKHTSTDTNTNPKAFAYVFFGVCAILAVVLLFTLASQS